MTNIKKYAQSFSLNVDEMGALYGLNLIARCLYIFGLRPYMDMNSGYVGRTHLHRKISYQILREELYVNPGRGIQNAGAPSYTQIKNGLKTLKRAGLIDFSADKASLTVQCLLTDFSVSEDTGNKADACPNKKSQNISCFTHKLSSIDTLNELESSLKRNNAKDCE